MAENGLATIIRMAEDVCAQEPIHLPGAIQPHGAMLILDPADFSRVALSANLQALAPLITTLSSVDWLPSAVVDACRRLTADGPSRSVMAPMPEIGLTEVHCFLAGDVIGVEFEIDGPVLPPGAEAALALDTRDTVRRLHSATGLEQLGRCLVDAVGRSTGFERVLVYKFDELGYGDVAAEYLVPDWGQSLLGFHFPASDIPAQARALYLRSLERWFPRRDYVPVSLVPDTHPLTAEPFDLALSRFRSVSPIHRMYQKNLGVDGAMSVSILHEGRLWGVLVAHHRQPHRVASAVRCHVATLTEAFALRLATLCASDDMTALLSHTSKRSRIIRKLAGADDFVAAMMEGDLVASDLFNDCTGVAMVYLDASQTQAVRRLGHTPPEADILLLMTWLRAHQESVFATDCVSSVYPAFAMHKEIASGVLSVFLGEDNNQAVLWFRPQVVQSITWSGRPEKTMDATGSMYLPRKSFDRWVEEKFGHSLPWHKWEHAVARSLRLTLNDVIIRQMRRIQQLEAEVQRFLWVTSHDLREPLRAVNIYTELLHRNYAPLLDEKGLEYIGYARQGAVMMDKRLRGLIAYSEIGQAGGKPQPVSLEEVLLATKAGLADLLNACGGQLRVLDTLPTVLGEWNGLCSVFDHLVSNALTFRSPNDAPDIRIWAEALGDKWQIAIADNGVGISPEHHARVFEMYQRLGPSDAAMGAGLGLTLCRRIVEHLGGRIWLTSNPGRGTTVYFTLPRLPERRPLSSAPDQRQPLAPAMLHEAVRDSHGRIEQTPLMAPLAAGRVSPQEYCRALAALYGFYRPAEEILFSCQPNLAMAMGVRPKLPALVKDLSALGLADTELAALPLCMGLSLPMGMPEQIGMLYVLEGATLGGQVVRKRIAHSLGPLAELATAFHGFHEDRAGSWWKQFQQEMTSRLDPDPVALQRAVQSALATFNALEAWLASRP
jgi:light-regulated signal transduction histidine kinase (bacteriophytochrome)/heme oxygenase